MKEKNLIDDEQKLVRNNKFTHTLWNINNKHV